MSLNFAKLFAIDDLKLWPSRDTLQIINFALRGLTMRIRMLDKIKWQAVTGAEVEPFLNAINPISGVEH